MCRPRQAANDAVDNIGGHLLWLFSVFLVCCNAVEFVVGLEFVKELCGLQAVVAAAAAANDGTTRFPGCTFSTARARLEHTLSLAL